MSWSAIVLALAGCGRVAFDPFGSLGDGPHGDTGAIRDAPADAASIPSGPKIWLRMDHDPATGPGIIDSAGGHASTCMGGICPSEVTGGIHAGAYSFTMEEVDVANAADLDSSAGFTGAIWFKVETIPSAQACIWTKPFNSGSGFDTFTICLNTDTSVSFDGETPGGTAIVDTAGSITTGVWHHAATVWNGATRTDYLDGVSQGSMAATLGVGTEDISLGSARGHSVQGRLDDALYYTRALSAAEILQLATP